MRWQAFQEILIDIPYFCEEFFTHWQSYAWDMPILLAVEVWERYTHSTMENKFYFLILGGIFSFVSFFQMWRRKKLSGQSSVVLYSSGGGVLSSPMSRHQYPNFVILMPIAFVAYIGVRVMSAHSHPIVNVPLNPPSKPVYRPIIPAKKFKPAMTPEENKIYLENGGDSYPYITQVLQVVPDNGWWVTFRVHAGSKTRKVPLAIKSIVAEATDEEWYATLTKQLGHEPRLGTNESYPARRIYRGQDVGTVRDFPTAESLADGTYLPQFGIGIRETEKHYKCGFDTSTGHYTETLSLVKKDGQWVISVLKVVNDDTGEIMRDSP